MAEYVSPPMPQARILVAEDETTTRKAVGRGLELIGYRVDEADSGSLALTKLSSSVYDVLLLDLRMPGIDGLEVLKRVQESQPDLQVIVFTAHATLESAIEAVRAGAVDYLLKPCSIRQIEAVIRRALQRRQERLRRQHLIRVMGEALAALQAEEEQERGAPRGQMERFVRCGPLALDREKRLVVISAGDGAASLDAELTAHEEALLVYLMQHPETVLSPRELAHGALGYEVSGREAGDIVRPHISRLRKKIEPDPAQPRLIRTIRGKGYLFSPG